MDIKEPKFDPKALSEDYKKIFNNMGHVMAVLFTIDLVIYLFYRYPYIQFYRFVEGLGLYTGFLCAATIAWLLLYPILIRIIIPAVFTVVFVISLFINMIMYLIGELNDRLVK